MLTISSVNIMKLLERIKSLNLYFYVLLFIVTQITGLLLSLVISYIIDYFTWLFVQMALVNSLILGLGLAGGCFLIQRLIQKIKPAYLVMISFSIVLGVSIISFLVLLISEPTLFIYYDRGTFSFLVLNFLFIVGLYIISSGLIIYQSIMIEKEKAIGNERYLKNQMEIKLLSSRINPHFLFNTLNLIITLLKQPEKAERAILNLSDLLRENLEQSDKVSIPAKEEIENVRKYLEIQKLRFNEKLTYEISGEIDFTIPPLIIQPLVENSIKHNIQNVSALSIAVCLTSDCKCNRITVIDSVGAMHPSMFNLGNGLTITKKRVESSNGSFLIKNGGIEISFDL